MIFYKTSEEVELIRQSSLLVSKTLATVAGYIKPGITTAELDTIAEEYIRDHGAVPGFKGYSGFPATLCTSVNEAVVHGLPGKRALQDGDILSIDCGVIKEGFYGDSAYTFAIGEVAPDILDLLKVTKEALYLGIEQARVGKRIGDIGYAIQHYAEKEHPYSIVRSLVGHGLGRNLHEEPEVPNFGRQGNGVKIREGLVIAIEPMINMGKKEVINSPDGWTVVTLDNLPSAHYEHTIAIGNKEADILSSFEFIEESVKKNIEIEEIIAKK